MNARRATLVLALVLSNLVAPACLYVGGRARVGAQLSAEQVLAIRPGESTRADVLALLGPPSEYLEPELAAALLDDSLRLDGVLDVARRAESLWTWQADLVAANGSVLLLWNGVWVSTHTDLIVVGFDANGRVTHVASTLASRP